MKSGKNLYYLLIVFIILTLGAILILNFYPSNVVRTTHQTSTPNGVISFNVYQPSGLTQPVPVVVIGHGIIVNKEMMTNFAIELAHIGYIVASIDWSGHGQSTGDLVVENLSVDLEAVIAALKIIQPLANMSALALLGYSMGGFPTYSYAVSHPNVTAWVGVGSSADGTVSNTTNPHNVLMVVGSLDEAFPLDQAKVEMLNLTGFSDVNDIEFNTLYGAIENGTAREIHVVPGMDHLITPWVRDCVETATAWIVASFGMVMPSPSMNAFDVRAGFAWIGFFALVGLLFTLATILVDPFHLKKETSTGNTAIDPQLLQETSWTSFIGKYYLFTFLLLPTIMIFIPLLVVTPLMFTALLTAVNGCFGVNVLFYSWRLAKRWKLSLKSIIKTSLFGGKNIWLYSIILTVVFFFGYYLSIGLNYLGMIPSTPRISYLILYSALLFFIILFSSIFIQKFSIPYMEAKFKIKNPVVNYLVISSINFLLVDSWFVILIMTLCIAVGNYFIAMILILMVPIFLFLVFFGIYIEKRTGSLIPGALLNAILLGFVITTLSPYGPLFALFGRFL